jgi:hypothetical protein
MPIYRNFYGSDGTRTRDLRRDRPAFRSVRSVPLGPLSYWRTGCRVLGRVLGELTGRLGKPPVKPNSGQKSAEIAPRSPRFQAG